VHLLAAGVWMGALVHVVRAGLAWRGHRAALRYLITGYARWAAWAFALVVVTGTAALILVPADALTTTGYGRLRLAKLSLVAVAAGAALTARRWLRRDSLGDTLTATRVEVIALGTVLAVTATLVSTPTARDSQPVAPPPPDGIVLPLATLAGQVGVAVAANDGQVVVRLTAPKLGDYYQAGPPQPYQLAARLHTTGTRDQDVRLRGCGEGCYVGEVEWAAGDNLLTLAAHAEGWQGGTVTLLVPWPVLDATARLARVAAAMRTAGPITVYESVTSDTSTGPGQVVPIRMSGAQFLATEPYSSGQALPSRPDVCRRRRGESRGRVSRRRPLCADDHRRPRPHPHRDRGRRQTCHPAHLRLRRGRRGLRAQQHVRGSTPDGADQRVASSGVSSAA